MNFKPIIVIVFILLSIESALYILIRYNKIIDYGTDPVTGEPYTTFPVLTDTDKNPFKLTFYYWIQERFFWKVMDYERKIFEH